MTTPMLIWFAFAAHAAPAMVAVPAGETLLRSIDQPPVRAQLSAFRIDRAEVSIDEFEAFAAQGYQEQAHWSPDGWTWAQAHPGGLGSAARAAGRTGAHPVVGITWFEADAYCRARGARLPTEAEWEHAACGGDGRRFPWGDQEPALAPWYTSGKHGHITGVHTQTAAQADPSLRAPTGAVHMAGNVWEWTADAWRSARTGGPDPTVAEGTWRVLRGGSFMNLPSYCTCGHREPATPDRQAFTTGFRCARSP